MTLNKWLCKYTSNKYGNVTISSILYIILEGLATIGVIIIITGLVYGLVTLLFDYLFLPPNTANYSDPLALLITLSVAIYILFSLFSVAIIWDDIKDTPLIKCELKEDSKD